MQKHFTIALIFLSLLCYGQESIEDLLKIHNSGSIPYITANELAMPKTEAIVLDARETSEYNISHLKNAIHVGYDQFNIKSVKNLIKDKAQTIVVYCSVGIRSEDIAEQLKKEGYTNVYNLFGGIFEWKNKALFVYDNEGQLTDNIHAYSEEWGKWLTKGIKVYD